MLSAIGFIRDYFYQWTITTEEDYNNHKEDVVNYWAYNDKESEKVIYLKKK